MGKLQAAPGEDVAAGAMVKAEEISLLVDGELDVERIESVCTRLRDADSMTTWVCYHVIGDALRGSSAIMPGFAARFATRLAAEPTVLSPPRRGPAPAALAWAAAATVAAVSLVGWVAMTTLPMGDGALPAALATAPGSLNWPGNWVPAWRVAGDTASWSTT